MSDPLLDVIVAAAARGRTQRKQARAFTAPTQAPEPAVAVEQRHSAWATRVPPPKRTRS